MARVVSQLIPGQSGANFTAQFDGNANEQALDRATEITVWGGTAAAAVEILDPNGTWRASGTVVPASLVTHFASPPVCKGIRVAGEAPAATPPVRVSVRHDVGG